MDAELARHVDQLLQDQPVHAAVVVQMPQQVHVVLDQVELEAAEHVDGGIAAAEVVQPEPVTRLADLPELAAQMLRPDGQVLLGDLDDEIALVHEAVKPILLIEPVHLAHDVRVVKVLPGEVHGDRHQRQAAIPAEPDLAAHLLEHVQIELVELMVFQQRRDEVPRRDDAALRIDPAGQALEGRDLPALHPVERMVVDLDPALVHCPVEVLHDIAALPVGIVRLLRKERDLAVQVVLDASERVPGVIQRLGQLTALGHGADAGAYPGGVPPGPAPDHRVDLVQPGFQHLRIVLTGDDDKVVVRAPDHQRLRKLALQGFGGQAEEPVALLEAVLVVVRLHGFDVRIDQVRGMAVGPDGGDLLVAILVHVVDVRQLRQPVRVEAVPLEERIRLQLLPRRLPGRREIDVGDDRQLRPVRHGLPLAEAVELRILRQAGFWVLADLAAEHDVIGAALMQKVVADPGDHADVIGVHPLEHADPQPIQDRRPVHARVAAKAVRGEDRHGAAADVLIVDERKRAALICSFQILGEGVHGSILSHCALSCSVSDASE